SFELRLERVFICDQWVSRSVFSLRVSQSLISDLQYTHHNSPGRTAAIKPVEPVWRRLRWCAKSRCGFPDPRQLNTRSPALAAAGRARRRSHVPGQTGYTPVPTAPERSLPGLELAGGRTVASPIELAASSAR